jgi:hypothetical protein
MVPPNGGGDTPLVQEGLLHRIPWPRSDILALIGVLVAAVGSVAAVIAIPQLQDAFTTIGPRAIAGIAVLFFLIVGGVIVYALRHTGPTASSGPPLTGSQINGSVPPAQVVEMIRILLERLELERSLTRTFPS